MFKVQNPKIEKFQEKCGDDPVLVQCYKNKIEYGCSYNNEIEQKIIEIEQSISDETPLWELLD